MNHSFARTLLLSTAMCLALVGVATSGLFLGGCSDARSETLNTTSTGLAQTSASITSVKIDVNKTNKILESIKSGADLNANLALLKEQSVTIKSSAALIKSKYDELVQNSDKVTGMWKAEIEEVKDPTLKASAGERSARVKESVMEITQNLLQVKEAYVPFISTVDDLIKFLEKDNTASGVKVAAPTIDKATKSGVDVQVQLQMVSSKLDNLSGSVGGKTK